MLRIVIFVAGLLIAGHVMALSLGGGSFKIGKSHNGEVIVCDYTPASEGGSGQIIDTPAALGNPSVRLFVPSAQCALYPANASGQPLCENGDVKPEDGLCNDGSEDFGTFAIDVTYSGGGSTGDDPDSGHGNNGPKSDGDNPGNSDGPGGGAGGGSSDPTTGICEAGVINYTFECGVGSTTYGGVFHVGPEDPPSWTACSGTNVAMVNEDDLDITVVPPGCVLTVGGYPVTVKGKKTTVDLGACDLVFPNNGLLGVSQVLDYTLTYANTDCTTGPTNAGPLEARYCHEEDFLDDRLDKEALDCNPVEVDDGTGPTEIVYHTGETEGAEGQIDITGQFDANPTINLGCNGDLDNGNIPMTILGSADFDVRQILLTPGITPTVTAVGALAGKAAPVKANFSFGFKNGDQYEDVVLKFYSCQEDGNGLAQLITEYGEVAPDGTSEIRVVGETLGGTTFFGVATVDVN